MEQPPHIYASMLTRRNRSWGRSRRRARQRMLVAAATARVLGLVVSLTAVAAAFAGRLGL